MTLQKIAKYAGVSVSTASKALSNSRDVSAETKALVLQAAEKLGYYNENKRRKLENRRVDSPTVGIICPEIISVYYSGIVTCLCRKISEKGGKASVFISEFDGDCQRAILHRCMAESSIDGVISLENPRDIDEKQFSMPLVFLSHAPYGDCVYSDMEGGLSQAVSYLLSMGHRQIGFVGEPLTYSKQDAFCRAMKRLTGSVSSDFLFCEEGRFEQSGKLAAEKIAGSCHRPTALIAAYDEVAYGLIATLRERGIRVPEDISVIGINDIPTSKFLDTPLTTLQNDTEEICCRALELLYLQMKEPNHPRERQCEALPCRLICRSTVTNPPV